jgi:hypothetical protein
VVCPRCKRSEGNVCKSFTLWRLPPVLVVQLKRFQFDHVSRRKLNNHIDFPFEDLDLYDYLASSRQRTISAHSEGSAGQDGLEGAGNATGGNSASLAVPDAEALARAALYGDEDATVSLLVPPAASMSLVEAQELTQRRPSDASGATGTGPEPSLCTKYDLYSVVHHAGALGGGHYATTARSLSKRSGEPFASSTGSNHSTAAAEGANGGGGSSSSTALEGDAWYCFNDNIVSRVPDPRTVCDSSAYVLFYLRQDMRQGDVLALLRAQLSVPHPVIEEAAPDSTAQSTSADTATGTAAAVAGGGSAPNESVLEGESRTPSRISEERHPSATTGNGAKFAERAGAQSAVDRRQEGTVPPPTYSNAKNGAQNSNNSGGSQLRPKSRLTEGASGKPQTDMDAATNGGCIPS